MKTRLSRRLVPLFGVALCAMLASAQPRFVTTGTMKQARVSHTATVLANGKVLVVGGTTPTGITNTAEIYDPATGRWRYTSGSLNSARAAHAAVRLSDGNVLIVGGITQTAQGNAQIGTVEIFDPVLETFTFTTPLNTGIGSGRAFNVGGDRIVFVQRSQASDLEVFNYSTKQWSPGSLPPSGGWGPAMTMLADGRIFASGGYPETADAAVYSPGTNTWQVLAPMTQARNYHTAVTLQDGRVFIATGLRSSFGQNFLVPTTELYSVDAVPGGTTAAGPTINGPGPGGLASSSTLLANGSVLLTGGGYTPAYGASLVPLADAAVYDPQTNAITSMPQMNVARHDHAAVLLQNGLVLITGGTADQAGGITPVAELFGTTGFPSTSDAFTATGSMMSARSGHQAVTLKNGLVLFTGGTNPQGATLASAELYDPATRTFRFTRNSMNSPRSGHSASVLADGRVLIVGGSNGQPSPGGRLSSTELFDPSSETFTPGPSMNYGRIGHQAVTLADGRVMVISGYYGSLSGPDPLVTTTAEIFNPSVPGWTVTAPIPDGRCCFAATRLLDGRVLVSGGYWGFAGDGMRAVYTYDVNANAWSTMAPMLRPRQNHNMTTLPNGKVLIIGGNDGTLSNNDSELYDPGVAPNGASISAGAIALGGWGATALLLPDGTVWAAGGYVQRWNGAVVCSYGRTAAQSFDYRTGAWTDLASMQTGRTDHSAAILATGQVVVAGGIEHACGATSFYIGSLNVIGDAEVWTGSTPQTGVISVTTNSRASTFTIVGPATFNGSGKSFTQASAPPGVYTITYGGLAGCPLPVPETKTLAAGGSITFGAVYTTCLKVTSNITNAPFSISPVVQGFLQGGVAPATYAGIPANQYTITFGSVAGYLQPSAVPAAISSGDMLSVVGTYTASSFGTVLVSTNNSSASFAITSSLKSYSGTGTSFVGGGAPAGSYTITFNKVPGYYTPPPQTLTLSPNGSVQFTGTYRRVIVVLFTGYGDAPTTNGVEYPPLPDSGDNSNPGIVNLAAYLRADTFFDGSLTAQVFTYYDDPSNKSGSDADHTVAQFWLTNVAHPGADDVIVVVGHSYGGNRARLFIDQIARAGYAVAGLVTIDPISWLLCTPSTVPDGISCDQKNLQESKPDNVSQLLSFTQNMSNAVNMHGYHLWTNPFNPPYTSRSYGYQELTLTKCLGDVNFTPPFVVCAHREIPYDSNVRSQTRSFVEQLLTSPPEAISNIRTTNVTANSATISWNTIRSSEGQVLFATDSSLTRFYVAAMDSGVGTAHTATITGLTPGQVYYFRVSSTPLEQTASGTIYSSIRLFNTLASGSPTISATIIGFDNIVYPNAPTVLLELRNSGTATATGCRVTKASIGTVLPSVSLPISVPDVVPGGSSRQTIPFPGPIGPAGTLTSILVSGDCAGKPFSAALRPRL